MTNNPGRKQGRQRFWSKTVVGAVIIFVVRAILGGLGTLSLRLMTARGRMSRSP